MLSVLSIVGLAALVVASVYLRTWPLRRWWTEGDREHPARPTGRPSPRRWLDDEERR